MSDKVKAGPGAIWTGGDAASMNLVTLDGSEVDADPGRLAVEAKTSSLFGDRRIVRVRNAGKGAVMAATELLDDPGGAVVVLEAGNLTPRDALRALVEGGKRGRALPCYPDTDESLVRLINEWLAEAGIKADPDVAETLRDILGNAEADQRMYRDKAAKRGDLPPGRPHPAAEFVPLELFDTARSGPLPVPLTKVS